MYVCAVLASADATASGCDPNCVHCTHGGHVALEARRLVHDKRLSVVPVAARGTRLDLCRQLHWRLPVRVTSPGRYSSRMASASYAERASARFTAESITAGT